LAAELDDIWDNAVANGTTVISGGLIKAEFLDVNAIKADIINTDYIEGLTLNFDKGTIGSWEITGNFLYSSVDGNNIYLDSSTSTITCYNNTTASVRASLGLMYLTGGWTDEFGFALHPTNGSAPYVQFTKNITTNALTAKIAGINFDDQKLYTDHWFINKDGSFSFGAGGITGDASGNMVIDGTLLADSIDTDELIAKHLRTRTSGERIELNRAVNSSGDPITPTNALEFYNDTDLFGSPTMKLSDAKLIIEYTGYKFLRINDLVYSNALMHIRSDAGTALNISTYSAGGRGLYIIAGAGAEYAIESYGNVKLSARSWETIELIGEVNVDGDLAVSGDVNVDGTITGKYLCLFPSSTASNAPNGSLYINSFSDELYYKNPDGTTFYVAG